MASSHWLWPGSACRGKDSRICLEITSGKASVFTSEINANMYPHSPGCAAERSKKTFTKAKAMFEFCYKFQELRDFQKLQEFSFESSPGLLGQESSSALQTIEVRSDSMLLVLAQNLRLKLLTTDHKRLRVSLLVE